MTQTTWPTWQREATEGVPEPVPGVAPEVTPAWDPLRDPLWVVETMQWLTDALAYLLVTRACERHEATPLPAALRTAPGELGDLSDREQLALHTECMGELWWRLTRLYEHFERPVLDAPPGVRERAVASLHRPALWPVAGRVEATATGAGG